MKRRLTRHKVRRLARESYIEAAGDLNKAESLMRQKLEAYGFVDLAIIAAVLQICWILWQFWQSFNLITPPESPMQGEPHVEMDD